MIPKDATRVEFQAKNKHKYVYWVWLFNGRWFWTAPGNGGSADTQEAAMSAARLWMRDGVAGRAR